MAFDWGNDISQSVEDALTRLPDYNSGAFNAGTNPRGLGAGGHITNFPAALDDTTIVVGNGLPPFANLMKSYADAAAASAASAGSVVTNLSGTSSSTVTLTTGSKTFTTQSGKTWPLGTLLHISSDANPNTHWMVIQVTSYSGTTLQGDVKSFSGTASRADWTIRLAGFPGRAAGAVYLWNTNTAAAPSDPGTGSVRLNATVALATAVHISENDFDGNALGQLLATWDDSTSAIKGRMLITSTTQPGNFAVFDITGTFTDQGVYDTFPVAHVTSGGTLAQGMMVQILFIPNGNAGTAGPAGPSFAGTSTTSLAIGTGTKAFVTQSGLAYSVGMRARATDAANTANWVEGVVTSYSGTALTITADNSSGSGTIANWNINIAGERGAQGTTGATGAPGAPGATGSVGPAGPTTAPTWNFDTTNTAADPGTNNFRMNSGTIGSVSALYFNEQGVGGSMAAYILSWDDSTNTAHLGTLMLIQTTDPSKYAIFTIVSVTDQGTWDNVAVTYVAGPGGFTAGATVAVSFTRSGNAGAGAGDVTGPASSTNNNVVLFSSSTGKAIKDSGVQLGALASKGTIDSAALIADGVVTLPKLATQAAGTVVANTTGGTASPTAVTNAAFKTALALVPADVGLGNVDNVSDVNKPVSTAQAAINAIKKIVGVRATTTANITISTALNNADVLDGVTLANGDLVLVKDQTSAAENGIYVVGVTPVRHGEYDTYNEHAGALVTVSEGTAGNDTVWLCSSNAGGTLNSTAITFIRFSGTFPSITTDNSIARYDGTAGNLQNSGITIDDSNNITGVGSLTTSGIVSTPAAASGSAGLRMPHGAAPTAPVNGDVWTTTAGLFARINGVTYTWATLEATETITGAKTFSGVTTLPATVNYAGQGSIIKSGAHALTLTTTATSAPTFPAGSSTLSSIDAGNWTATLKPFGKQTMPVPAAAMTAPTTNGAASGSVELATNDIQLTTRDFDQTTLQKAQFCFPAPKQLDETATVTFRATWTGSAAGSGGVAWSLKARAVGDGDAMDGVWGTGVTVTDTFISANTYHRTAESGAVTIGNSFAEGDLIFFEIAREVANGADTLAQLAKLISLELYLTTNAANDA